MTILAYAEGLLWSRRDRPILGGYRLLMPLVDSHRVIVATAGKAEMLEHRLKTEGLLARIAEVVDDSVALPMIPLWRRQYEQVRSRNPLDFVITADPIIAEWVVDQGDTALFFCHPGFNLPAQRAERGKAAWGELVEEVEARL